MRTPLKILLAVAGLALALFVALVVVVTVVFEPDDYRGYLVAAVEDATGRPFALDGELGLGVLPCCSVELGPARLGNPADFPPGDFVTVRAASASLKLWPLLFAQEVRIGTVTLEGVNVALLVREDGTVNWELTGAETEPAATEPDAGTTPPLQVEALRVIDATLGYEDRQTGAAYAVTGLTLETGRIDFAGDRLAPLPVELALTARDAGLDLEARVEARLTVGLDGDAMTLDAERVTLEAEQTALTVTGRGTADLATGELAADGTLSLAESSPRALLAKLAGDAYRPADPAALTRLAAEGRWRVAGDTVEVEALRVRLDDSELTAAAVAEAFGAGPVRGELRVDRMDLARYLPAETEPSGAEGPPGRLAVEELVASARLAGEALELDVAARAEGGRIALRGGGTLAEAGPALQGTLELTDLSPRRLLAGLDAAPETADPNVLNRLAGTARWQLGADSAAIEDLRWQLDDTRLTGRVGIDGFDRPSTRFELTIDRIDLDAYLPPDTEEEAAEAEATTEIPVELIRDLDLAGQLRIGSLGMMDLTLTELAADVRAADGVLRLEPISARLYGGRYDGRLTVDATGPRAKLDLEQRLSAVQVGELAQSFFASDALSGSLTLELKGSGTGNAPEELLDGLAGALSFELADGVYRGVNLVHELRRARASLRNEPAPAEPAAKETPIRTLTASGRLVDGVLQTHALTADAGGLMLAGRGGLDLKNLALDYKLDAKLSAAAAEAAKLGDLAGLTIPLALEGPVTAPRVAVDLKGLIGGNLREALTQKARDTLLERLGGAAEKPPEPAAAAPDAAGDTPTTKPPAEEPSVKDALKRSLRDLLKPPPEPD
ncbi:MAG TPA: AsmA family protein [Pseudomonadales bacterium]